MSDSKIYRNVPFAPLILNWDKTQKIEITNDGQNKIATTEVPWNDKIYTVTFRTYSSRSDDEIKDALEEKIKTAFVFLIRYKPKKTKSLKCTLSDSEETKYNVEVIYQDSRVKAKGKDRKHICYDSKAQVEKIKQQIEARNSEKQEILKDRQQRILWTQKMLDGFLDSPDSKPATKMNQPIIEDLDEKVVENLDEKAASPEEKAKPAHKTEKPKNDNYDSASEWEAEKLDSDKDYNSAASEWEAEALDKASKSDASPLSANEVEKRVSRTDLKHSPVDSAPQTASDQNTPEISSNNLDKKKNFLKPKRENRPEASKKLKKLREANFKNPFEESITIAPKKAQDINVNPSPSASEIKKTKELENQVLSMDKIIQALRRKIEEFQNKQNEADEVAARFQKENEQMLDKIAEVNEQSDKYLQNLQEMRDQKRKLEEQIEQLKRQIIENEKDEETKQNLTQQLSQANVKLFETEEKFNDLDKANIELIEQLDKLTDQSDELKKTKSENSRLQNELRETKTECERLTEELEYLESKLLSLKEKDIIKEQELKRLESENVNLGNLAYNLEAELITAKSFRPELQREAEEK